MMKTLKTFAVVLCSLLILAVPASAGLVTSIPGGTVYPLPSVNYFGASPQTVAAGITWSSTNAGNQGGSVFGYTGGYGFGGNGTWSGALGPMAGLNDSFDAYGVTHSMTFAFDSPVFGVGGFLNYVPGGTLPTISAWDSSNHLIESAILSFSTGGGNDLGQFFGFWESTANISYFTLADSYIGLVNLTVAGEPGGAVPEPSYFGALGLAFAGLLAYARRPKKA